MALARLMAPACCLVAVFCLISRAHAADAIKPIAPDRLAKIVQQAPVPPLSPEKDLALKARLIDYIDCTDPADPHDFRDQGTSRIVDSPAGKYRATAPHRHAFFSYAYRTAGRDQPVLLLIEYPDDAPRVISFMTHDSMRATKPHLSFSEETGVYTGGPFPLTSKMQCFTLFAWPQDDWSPLITLNFGRNGGAGAARRIWVYAIDAMPALKLEDPDPSNPRTLDMFFPLMFLAQRDNFGWQSPRWLEHLTDYCQYLGINRVTMEVYANQSWGAMCTIPAWDADDKGNLEKTLARLDQIGGVGFVAGIVADGMYGKTTHKGIPIASLPPDKAREALLLGFTEFFDRYGKYKSLRGIALGSMETNGFYDLLEEKDAIGEVIALIRKKRPDLQVLTYLGNHYLQTPYFSTLKRNTDIAPVISDYVAKPPSWDRFLADRILAEWRARNHDPAGMRQRAGLTLYEQYAPDDHVLHNQYRFEPRSTIYFDTNNSPARSALLNTPYAAIFGTFTEGHIGLHADVNFWSTKPWTAPEFNPSAPHTLYAWATALGHHDRFAIAAGGWSVKYFGTERSMRQFSQNFHRLPKAEMQTLDSGNSVVRTRWLLQNGKRCIALQNLVPFESTVTVDDKPYALAPYELRTWSDASSASPQVASTESPAYTAFTHARQTRYDDLLKSLRAQDPAAAPAAFDQRATYSLLSELQLRYDVLNPPELGAPRIDSPIAFTGDLDAWPKKASDLKDCAAENITGHVFFPNSWAGPADLSARLRLAHDGKSLFLGLAVTDSVITPKDGVGLFLSREGFLNYDRNSVPFDASWQFTIPKDKQPASGTGKLGLTWTARRTPTGYTLEASVPLDQLMSKPNEQIGLLIQVSDFDSTPNLAQQPWAIKQLLLVPNRSLFPYWQDARSAARLRLAP